MTKSAKEVVLAVEKAWAANKLDELDQYFADSFKPETTIPQLPPGLEGAKMAHGMAMQSFPDRKVEVVEVVEDGTKVCVRQRVTGTNKGGFPAFGVPANNKKIDFQWISIYEVRRGKIVDHHSINDALTLLIQLGAITPPGM